MFVQWLRQNKQNYIWCLSYFPRFLGHFESSAVFRKMGDKPHTKAVKQDVCSQFLKAQQLNRFFKKAWLFWEKSEDKPKIRWMSKSFQWKTTLLWKALWLFGLFSRDEGDYIDVWMIKITWKQIKSKCMFASFESRYNIQKPCLFLKSGFFSYFIGLWI